MQKITFVFYPNEQDIAIGELSGFRRDMFEKISRDRFSFCSISDLDADDKTVYVAMGGRVHKTLKKNKVKHICIKDFNAGLNKKQLLELEELMSFFIGDKGESYFTQYLDTINLQWDKNISSSVAELQKYDIGLNSGLTFEIKYDKMAAKTGNAAVEFWNSKKDKPSGILATSADYYVYIFSEEEIYIYKTSLFKEFVEKNHFRIVYNAGDNNANIMLIDKKILMDYGVNIVNLSQKEFMDIIYDSNTNQNHSIV